MAKPASAIIPDVEFLRLAIEWLVRDAVRESGGDVHAATARLLSYCHDADVAHGFIAVYGAELEAMAPVVARASRETPTTEAFDELLDSREFPTLAEELKDDAAQVFLNLLLRLVRREAERQAGWG